MWAIESLAGTTGGRQKTRWGEETVKGGVNGGDPQKKGGVGQDRRIPEVSKNCWLEKKASRNQGRTEGGGGAKT